MPEFLAPALNPANTREQQLPLKASWLHDGAGAVNFCRVPALKIKREKRGKGRGGWWESVLDDNLIACINDQSVAD